MRQHNAIQTYGQKYKQAKDAQQEICLIRQKFQPEFPIQLPSTSLRFQIRRITVVYPQD